MVTTLARQRLPPKRGRPKSRFYTIAHRVAGRFEPKVAKAFTGAVGRLQRQLDLAEIRSALAGGELSAIEMAAGSGRLQALLAGDEGLRGALINTTTVTGKAGADVLTEVTGLEARFNARHPNVVLFAREQVGDLVVGVSDDVKEAVRIVVAAGADLGLTYGQQAVAIREVVGLPSNWARAPANLAQEIRAGRVDYGRRLSAADKQKIRSRIKAGTVDEAFVEEMQATYARSLLNRRALNIARTESLRAAHHGQREAWRQAVEQGVLPTTVRRVAVVTPDDRLRFTHAQVPGMNPGGVGLDEPFSTPWGPMMGPPWEPLCRCAEGLIFPRSDVGDDVFPGTDSIDPTRAVLDDSSESLAVFEEKFPDGFRGLSGDQIIRRMAAVPDDLTINIGRMSAARDQSNLTVGVTLRDASGKDAGRIYRVFEFDKKRVEHSHFDLADDLQGKGIGKRVLRQEVLLYRDLGDIDEVLLLANGEVGGYAWARMGFVPRDQDEWDFLRHQLSRRIEFVKREKGYGEELVVGVREVLESEDPRAIHLLADNPLGKDLLLGSSWKGKLQISDPDVLDQFLALTEL